MAKTETERHVLYNGTVEIDFYPKSHRYKLISVDGKKIGAWIKSPSGIVGKLDKSQPLMGWAVRCFFERVVEEMRDGVNFTRDDLMSMLEVGKAAYRERRQEAADVGTVVHEYALRHHEPQIKTIKDIPGFNELSPEDAKRAAHGAAAFDAWYKQLGGKSIKSEFLIYSKKQNYTGRCDDLVQVGNDLIILDYKTSKGVYTDQVYQVTSYMKAHEEEYPDQRIAGARLVHLLKEDVTDKEGNVTKKAGEFGEVYLSRADLVQAFTVFKALQVVAEKDPVFEKLIKAA